MSIKWANSKVNNKKHQDVKWHDHPCAPCLTLATLTLVIVFIMIFIICIRPAASNTEPAVYTVRKGDTLWDICRRHYGDTCDIREMIWRTRELNGIGDPGQLRPGMMIYLPVIVD